MSDHDFGQGFKAGITIGAVICIVIIFLVIGLIENHFKDEAIKANVAHYEVDSKTGAVKFIYNRPNEITPAMLELKEVKP